MSKLLKTQGPPVAQSFLGSALLETVSRGGPTVITWLFAHLAALRGWALPWIIVVASVVFLALSVSFHYLFRARKALPKVEPNNQPRPDSNALLESTEIKRLADELATLKTQFSEAQTTAHTLEVDLRGKKQQLRGVERELGKAQQEVQSLKNEYDEEHNAAVRLKTLNEQYEMQIKKLTSDAEETRRERLDAAGNLHGVETDRNNYRTWYNELAWLNPAIEPQKKDISNYIKVIAARPCLLNLTERIVIIDLVVRNDSFFDIRIKPGTVAGQLSTNKKGLLHDPAKAFVDLNHLPIENLKPTQEAMFAIKQPLLRTEAEEIEDAIAEGGDGYFWLGSLNISISVQNAEPLDVDSQPLRMNSDVEHVYFREFGSLTLEGEVITPQELARSVDALPFPERMTVYEAAKKAYDASLWRLHEAKQNEDPEEIANEAIKRNTNNA